jgi:DNA transformation protein
MAATHTDFALYCCELLSSIGRCSAKRMFGGWGISTDGLTLAIIANLGDGERLWLKVDANSRSTWETAGCQRFTYTTTRKGVEVTSGMDYYSAPEEAMDSTDAMRPWAQRAMEAALIAHAAKVKKVPRTTVKKKK